MKLGCLIRFLAEEQPVLGRILLEVSVKAPIDYDLIRLHLLAEDGILLGGLARFTIKAVECLTLSSCSIQ